MLTNKDDRELGVSPDWDDVSTVYDRMDAAGLLRQRCGPGSIVGHILSLAVFARAARYQERDFELGEFIEEYCMCKNIDSEELLGQIEDFLEDIGIWTTCPFEMLGRLSAL